MSKYKQSFIQGAMILLAAGIINRLLGFVPRITLPRVIGAEGVGLYQMGWPFLSVVLTITTGGIPLAIAKLVAEAESEGNEKRARQVLHISLGLITTLSLLFTLLSLVASPWITTHLFTDSRVYYTFICMSPIILIVGVSSVYRGYFQGRQNMIPTAVSQTFETLVRIVTMLACSYVMLPYGIEFAAAGAMFGVMIGELAGLAILLYQYAVIRKKYNVYHSAKIGSGSGKRDVLQKIFRISVPVTGSRLVGSSSYFLESILIVQSLAAAGVATAMATSQYGALQGMILPVLMLPSALTYSLSVSLIPSLSEAAARKDMKTIHKRLHQSLRLALVSGAPFAVIMYVLADPITYYLYNESEISVMLKMLAPIALFMYLKGPLEATLQALNRPGIALRNTLIGAGVKLFLIYWLASKPNFGILGAIMAINIHTIVVAWLNWSSVSRLVKFSMDAAHFFKVIAAMVIMGFGCYGVMNSSWISQPFPRFIYALLLGFAIYSVCIAMFKIVDWDDFKRIPWIGKKL
ncbi:stage V sporulation protein B [Paenibacillus sp. J2TS4]|uniref:stage V sporulation protein B n=1 Tax=Paenibacillus sp. J2TS4 TaxID=2807194 RepID=UPI001B05CB75|nr:stage V sporulation protein B [Paenibacillus sp. J2TS4]GIP31399.1 stage V sporulation protein B [Paenibacillus sp. J2TS4]